ncbi:MAG: hypothetical protein ABUL48_00230 [Pseudorhodoplanes sp.]
MRSSWIRARLYPRRVAAAAGCLVLCGLSLSAPLAFAQAPDQDAAPPVSAPPAPAAPPAPRGVFESIGRFFEQGASNFQDHLRGAKRKMDEDAAANSKGFSENAAKVGQGAAEVGKGAADATKNAMEAVAKLPTARMMNGRERCANAPNGAPDCVTAAEALCRKHGFATGKSMDFTSAEECPVKTILGQANECTTVTFISRAMCQ